LAESSINLTIKIKHVIKLVEPLAHCMGGSKSGLLDAIYTILMDERIGLIEEAIDEAVNPDIVLQKTAIGLRNQRVYAVKSGFNSLLDVARQTYKVWFSF
jgi:DNA mismatch repair protein MSH4